MADDERNKKCAHPGCKCRASGDSDYCSPYCENAKDMDVTELACSCGHPACA